MANKKRKRSKERGQSASGDIITVRVGDNASGVAAGKNVMQTFHKPDEPFSAGQLDLESALAGLGIDPGRLRQVLTEKFNDDELRNLYFDLAVDYEDLPGSTKSGKVRELILACARLDRLRELVERCRRLRPSAFL